MAVYTINIILIYVFAFFLLLTKPSRKKEIVYCTVVSLQWILISGLRKVTVGADTEQYKRLFESVKNTSWSTLFNNFIIYISGRSNNISDPGYPIIEKFFQIFNGNYQVFLTVMALFFMVTLAFWIYNNSSMPCLSFIVYSTLFFSFFSITGHRQTIATALVVFIGYSFIKKRKLIPFIVIVIIAFFIHKSSVCFLPFYFFANKKITIKYVAVFTAVSVVILALGKKAYGVFATMIGYSVDEEFIDTPITYLILVLLITILSFVLYKSIKNNRPNDYLALYNALMFAATFTVMTLRNQAFMRVQQYYSVFLMLMIPEMVKAFDKKWQIIPYSLGSGFLIYKMISGSYTYYFFWQ